ncbi:hypothetical protein BH23ACT4_BH23ACT4_07000 [soil metagenome]
MWGAVPKLNSTFPRVLGMPVMPTEGRSIIATRADSQRTCSFNPGQARPSSACEDWIVKPKTDLIRSRGITVIAGLAVLAVGLFVARLERFPEWDEAVFLGQSGGIDNIVIPPPSLVESRELGPPTVMTIIRTATDTLANTRLLWMALGVGLLVLAAVMISTHLRFPPALLIMTYGTYWLGLAFVGSFYGFYIAASLALIAVCSYLALRRHAQHQIRWGIALGLGLAFALWFRQIESFLVAICLVGHAAIVSPGAFWRRRWKGSLAAVLTLLLAFVVPWIVDSTIRYGSALQRIRGGSGRSFERGLSNQLPEYLDVLTGSSYHYANLGSASLRARTLIVAVVLIAIGLMAVGYARRRQEPAISNDDVRVSSLPLVATVGVLLLGFFLFFIGSVRDRYLLMGLIFIAALLSSGIWRFIENVERSRSTVALGLASLIVIWVAANVSIAAEYEGGRFEAGRQTQVYAQMLRELSEGQECVGISRYGAPTILFGSGCRTISAVSPQDAGQRAQELQETAGVVFVWWPEAEADLLGLPADEWSMLPTAEDEGAGQPVVLWWDD